MADVLRQAPESEDLNNNHKQWFDFTVQTKFSYQNNQISACGKTMLKHRAIFLNCQAETDL